MLLNACSHYKYLRFISEVTIVQFMIHANNSHLYVVERSFVIGDVGAFSALPGGGVGQNLPAIIVEQHREEQTPNDVEREEKAVECVSRRVEDEPEAGEQDTRTCPPHACLA